MANKYASSFIIDSNKILLKDSEARSSISTEITERKNADTTLENSITLLNNKFIALSQFGDTQANFVSALEYCKSNNKILFIDTYVTLKDLTISNANIRGCNADSYDTYGLTKGVAIEGSVTFEGCKIIGVPFRNSSGSVISNSSTFRDCAFIAFEGDVFKSAVTTTVIDSCSFVNNTGNCVSGCIDSRVVNSTFHSNHGNSVINLTTGNNDNIISGNKIEWNDGYGIDIYASNHNLIMGNIIDRNSKYGIRSNGYNTIITGNLLRRNGANENVQANCLLRGSNNTFTGNTCKQDKAQDDGTGTVIPKYSVYFLNFTGSVYGNYFDVDWQAWESIFNVHNVNMDTGPYRYIGEADSVDSGTNMTFTLPITFTTSDAMLLNIDLTWRTGDQSTYGGQRVTLLSYIQYDEYKGTFTGLPSTISATASRNSDNKIVLTFTSTISSLYLYVKVQ